MFGGKEGDMTDSNDIGSDYEALVRQATGHGLQGLDCTLVQLPSDQNGHHGVVLAAATTERGVFRAVGEAWRDLLPPARRGETLTLAETIAKSRALREALGMPIVLASKPIASVPAPAGGGALGRPEGESERVSSRTATVGSGSVDAAVPASLAQANTSRPSVGPLATSSDGKNAVPRAGLVSGGEAAAKPVTPDGAAKQSSTPLADEHGSDDAEGQAKPSHTPIDGLGTDMVNRLLQMTKRKATIEGNPAGDEEALQRLDSYFQRAFGHPLAEATRMEGQRVIQRLAADLSRTGAGQGRTVTG
jgi:hypothetical protein